MKRKKQKNNLKYIISIIAAIFVILSSFFIDNNKKVDSFEVHFIDVDQGDSILIRTPNDKNILVDSGSRKNEHLLFSHLNSLGISKFDTVIATHPDEDHIGSMQRVITEFDIEKFYMPNKTHTTSTYSNMLKTLKQSNTKVIEALANDVINVDEDTKIYILHPDGKTYTDNNAYSIVTKVVYKNNSFLLTGDIDSGIEQKLIQEYGEFLKSDVIKLAHHGSASSNSKSFIQMVNPVSAVVSAGKNNSYSHPHKEVLAITKKLDIPIYRTDEQGSIIFYSDGTNISVNKDTPGSYKYNKYKNN